MTALREGCWAKRDNERAPRITIVVRKFCIFITRGILSDRGTNCEWVCDWLDTAFVWRRHRTDSACVPSERCAEWEPERQSLRGSKSSRRGRRWRRKIGRAHV